MSEDAVPDLFVTLLSKVRHVFGGVLSMVQDGEVRQEAFAQLGLSTTGAALDTSAAQTALAALDQRLAALAGFAATAEAVVALSTAIGTVLQAHEPGIAAEDILYGLASLYATTAIRVRAPEVWAVFKALGFVADVAFDFGNVGKFISSTGSYLDGLTQAPSDAARADNWALIQGAVVGAGAIAFPSGGTGRVDIQTLYGWEPDPATTRPNADAVLRRTASLQLHTRDAATHTEDRVIVTTAVVPPAQGGWGLFGAVSGSAAWTLPIGDAWELKLEGALADGVEFFLGNNSFFRGGGAIDPSIQATFRRSDKVKGVTAVGGTSGSHLEFDKFSLQGTLASSSQGVLLQSKGTALVISGFLQPILPQQIRLECDLGIGVDSRRGFVIDGGTKLEATVPINKSIAGLQVQHATIGLTVAGTDKGADFELELSAAFGLTLGGGAFSASVDRIGLNVSLTTGHGGNTALGDIGVGFKPPNGIGISVDAAIVKGGGYLFFDADKEEYGGIADLKILSVEVKAIGLLSTKFPDGTKGFSCLLIISVEFDVPFPLPFGFALTGIGGLVGIHHAIDTDQLEAGIRNHALDHILFPKDPVATAPLIISTMRSVFPAAPGRFVFGPIFKIGWPAIPKPPVTITLGVIFDVPAPVRIVIIGQVVITLPIPAAPVVTLKADVLGIIDFAKGLVSVDVSLNDSKIAGFAVSGDIAVRVHWKGGGEFIFSCGGFNPHYQAPADLPALKRLAIDISGSSNPRLRLEAYLALTSNTFQIGARASLHAAAGPFAIDGWLGFDALIQWSPKFYFIVEITAGISLSFDGDTLLGVSLDFSLSGPGPWDAAGKATITILFWDVSVHFHETWGEDDAGSLPPATELVGQVAQAVALPASWEGQLPADGDGIVTLNPRQRDGIVVHPLGVLQLRQRVAPLGVKLDRLGTSRLLNAQRVELGAPSVNGVAAAAPSPVTDRFARAQFIDMTDDQKLSLPSFEDFTAGVRVAPADELTGPSVETDVAYETRVLKQPGAFKVHQMVFSHASAFAGLGGAGRSSIAGASRYVGVDPAKSPVVLGPTAATTVVSPVDLKPVNVGAAQALTYTLAAQALDRHLTAHPEDRGTMILVGAHEAKGTP